MAISLCNSQDRWRDSGHKFIIVALQTVSETPISHTSLPLRFTVPNPSKKRVTKITLLQLVQAVQQSLHKFRYNTKILTFINMYPMFFSLSSHLKYTALFNYPYLKNNTTHDTNGSIQLMTRTEICDPGFQVLAGGDQWGQPDTARLCTEYNHRISNLSFS